jgi:lipopolysaccharide/colanic/teichoic acid biosynthesis glycosyltransferase
MDATDVHIESTDPALQKSYQTYELAKRILDVTVALVAIVLFGPLWIMIAIAVRFTSPGPAFYCQRRVVGKAGREFTVYKFRTMVHNNDDTLHKHAIARFIEGQPLSIQKKNGATVPVFKIANDPRITSFGRVLRKSGLDEVPQFLNVLRGDMSVVGPRPPIYYEYQRYNDHHRQRLNVLPGITGLYQVTARSEVTFDKMVELDLEYIARRSLRLDIWIILKTPWVMLTGKGAH